MKRDNVIRVALCVLVFGILIASAFVNVSQTARGSGTPVGDYETVGNVTEVPVSADGGVRSFADLVSLLDGRVAWGLFMCCLLVGTGLYLSIRSGFLQFRKFGHIMKNTVGRLFRREKAEGKDGALSPFQALCTAMAGTVGTGNIAGVAGAVVIGGPGAVFWMWIAALVGMMTKFGEIVLAVRFREKNDQGEWVGGPMYYIKNGLGKGWKWLSGVFSLFGALAAFGIGAMTQVNTIAGSIVTAAGAVNGAAVTDSTGLWIRIGVGLVVAALLAVVTFGGLKRIGAVTEKIVPFMSIFYIIGALVIIIANAGRLGMVFSSIFRCAFTGEAVVGGVSGFVFLTALQKGVGRGVFSNEAGLGSAPIAHATTSEENPVKQGLYGVFEVFMDTVVICTLTALVLMCANVVPWGDPDMAGADAAILAFGTVFGSKLSSLFVAVAIFFFAFSTILSWSLYGSRCFGFLTKNRAIPVYKAVFVLAVAVGAVLKLSLVWDIADTLNGFMAVPNLIALLALSGTVITMTRDYLREQRKN